MAAQYYPAPGLGSDVLCPRGQVEDYDPSTGQYLGVCVDDTSAYRAGPVYQPPPAQPPTRQVAPYNAGSLGTVNVSAGPVGTDTYILVGAAAILFFFMMKRR